MSFTYSVTISDPNKLRYTVPAKLNTAADLRVLINSIQVLNFTVEGEGPDSNQFDVVFDAAPVGVAGDVITFERTTQPGRIADFSSATNWTPDAFNQEFDNLHTIASDLTGGAPAGVDLGTLDTRVTDLETNDAVQDTNIATNTTGISDLLDRALLQPADGQPFDAEGQRVTNVGQPLLGTDAARLVDVQATVTTGLPPVSGEIGKYLRVNGPAGAEVAVWDQIDPGDIDASDINNDSVVSGATVKDALESLTTADAGLQSQITANDNDIATNAAGVANNASAIAGKVSKSGDLMTGNLSIDNPDGNPVVEFGGVGGSRDSYVGRVTNRVELLNEAAPDGDGGYRYTNDGRAEILYRGSPFRVLAWPEFFIEGTPNVTLTEGGSDTTFLTIDTLALPETGLYWLTGSVIFDAAGNANDMRVDVVADALVGITPDETKVLYPTNARVSSGASVYMRTKRNANDEFSIPFAFVLDFTRTLTEFRIKARPGSVGGGGGTIQLFRYSATAVLIAGQ